ncbi:ciliary microtubule inner protein 1 isoform X2 [Camelus bactrianus]|uniref:Ciliary microtubule inner protein 1 isoform X2 n=1 Tax=Camelus bactrianus TaxID=9837 RepID=A0AC58P0M9_CAMBA
MAQKPIGTEAAERMNLVAQDEIWKYRLKAENEARQNWAQNWGFLTTPLEELIQCGEEPSTPKPKIELPGRFRIRPVTPVEKHIKKKIYFTGCRKLNVLSITRQRNIGEDVEKREPV